jgi:hypothetical protein
LTSARWIPCAASWYRSRLEIAPYLLWNSSMESVSSIQAAGWRGASETGAEYRDSTLRATVQRNLEGGERDNWQGEIKGRAGCWQKPRGESEHIVNTLSKPPMQPSQGRGPCWGNTKCVWRAGNQWRPLHIRRVQKRSSPHWS